MAKLDTITEAEATKSIDRCLDRVVKYGDEFHIVLASGFKVYLGPPDKTAASADAQKPSAREVPE